MRKNGVLLHITSLPSKYGIGTLGKEAYAFVDFLKRADQQIWQVLPVCPTGYGDSPYASYSTFAGNPYLIDLETLEEEGLLKPEEYQNLTWYEQEDQVDFGKMYTQRYPILEKASSRFLQNPTPDYVEFCKGHASWLDDYALFMALKDLHQGKPWLEWETPYRKYDAKAVQAWTQDNQARVDYYKSLQYFFFTQWEKLRQYANKNGISI